LFGVLVETRYENPFLTDDWRAHLTFRRPDGRIGTGPGTTATVFVNRRNVEGGGRQDDRRHTSFREVFGVKGIIGGHWDYDLFFQTSQVHFQERYSHDFSISRGIRALDAVTDPVTGTPVCRSVLDGSDPNCVPYNVWSGSQVANAALAYLEIPGFQRARVAQQVAGGSVSANLGDYGIGLPWTRAGIEVAMGVERRTERLDFEADQAFASGDLAGQNQPVRAVKGSYTLNEIYGELRVPVMDVVNVSGSYRRSAYDPGETTDTFGVGFNAAPASFARLRGSYQRAVRAPNANELFSPQFGGDYTLGTDGDPCAGESPTRSFEDCRRTGLPARLYGHVITTSFQGFPATVGGNPRLLPETANTYTLGLVFTPARELSATLDYFDIRIEDTISSIDGAVIFGQCIDTGDPSFCSLITRDPLTGTLWLGQGNVTAINQNIGKTRVSGVDAALNYRLALPRGHVIAFDAIGTWLRRQSVEVFRGAQSTECAGMVFSLCGSLPLPEWRHRLRMTWKPQADLELAGTWRYVGSTTYAPATKVTGGLPSVSYFDVAVSWNATPRLTVRGGINNVADRDPPVAVGGDISGRVNGNSFAQVYDVLGRHVFVSATLRF
jgi:iron complex outermembrane receptor protein